MDQPLSGAGGGMERARLHLQRSPCFFPTLVNRRLGFGGGVQSIHQRWLNFTQQKGNTHKKGDRVGGYGRVRGEHDCGGGGQKCGWGWSWGRGWGSNIECSIDDPSTCMYVYYSDLDMSTITCGDAISSRRNNETTRSKSYHGILGTEVCGDTGT